MSRISRRHLLQNSAGIGVFAYAATACSRNETDNAPQAPTLMGDDGVATASKINNGILSGSEAVDAAIARAEQMEPKLNAIVTTTYDQARETAKSMDQGGAKGPMGGVPTLVKDLIDVTGVPTGFGSRAFAGYVAERQFPFVDNLEAMGVVSIGKSATPEFGLTATTEPLSSGITRNPWNLDRSSGGSSGGAASLVAAGVVPFAHASDGGGSIRIPASCCGTVGLKPSRDRFRPPRDERRMPVRISVQGVESRTVRDTAAFLAAMEYPEGEGKLAPVGLVTGPSDKKLKIGLMRDSALDLPIDPQVIAVVDEVAATCEGLGHEIVPMTKNFDPVFSDHFLLLWAAMADGILDVWEAGTGLTAGPDGFEKFTLGLRAHARANQDRLQQTVLWLIAFAQQYRTLFEGVDVLLSPVLAAPPIPLGYLATDQDFDETIAKLTAYAQFTAPANVSGAPSVSLPLGMSSDGLPIGAMFSAMMGEEGMLLELAYALEAATPWAGRKPANYAL